MYREKLNTGLAPRTVQYIHTTFHKALKDAVADGLVQRNVTEGIKAPRPRKQEVNALSADQTRAFLHAARGDRFEALFVVAVHCGLREGELLGLRWADVDLYAGTLAVRRTLSETKTGYIFEAPKNSKGRNVGLTSSAKDALRCHRAAQNQERLQAGSLWHDQDLVFPSYKGTAMNAKNLTSRYFKPLLAKIGLPHSVRLHDLRHTCATLLLSRGVHPKFVQELLGHATISITLDTYSHVLPSMGDQTAAAMEAVLS
jgi:integrase